MDLDYMVYTSKKISIHYHCNHGNVIDSNHGNGTQPNKDFEVFKKHRANDHLLTLLLSMVKVNGNSFPLLICMNEPSKGAFGQL